MKKNEIIENALDLFLEKGYEKTTITDIMQKTKLSKGGMYHHFSSKEEILEACTRKALEEEQVEFYRLIDSYDHLSDKLVALFFPLSYSTNYTESFTQFAKKQETSLVYYRIREIAREFGFKNLKELILLDQQEEIFSFDHQYIDEVVNLLYMYGEDLSFRLKKSENQQKFLQKELSAFIYIINAVLKPTDDFCKEFEQKLFKLIEAEN